MMAPPVSMTVAARVSSSSRTVKWCVCSPAASRGGRRTLAVPGNCRLCSSARRPHRVNERVDVQIDDELGEEARPMFARRRLNGQLVACDSLFT